MQTPNASQWNIGGVGSCGVGACIGHVHFMLFVSILFALGTQHKRIISGIWAIIAWLVRTLSYYGLLVLLGHVGYFDTSAMHLD